MDHPCVITLDRDSAPRTVFSGDQLIDIDLPAGTRVIYPKPTLAPLSDVDAAIRYALTHPEGSEPLYAKLRPGMKVTIAIDDISLPLPPMKRPDIRERILTIVLALLSDHGVDDVHIIVATGIHVPGGLVELDLVRSDRDVTIGDDDITGRFGDAEILIVVGEVALDVQIRGAGRALAEVEASILAGERPPNSEENGRDQAEEENPRSFPRRRSRSGWYSDQRCKTVLRRRVFTAHLNSFHLLASPQKTNENLGKGEDLAWT